MIQSTAAATIKAAALSLSLMTAGVAFVLPAKAQVSAPAQQLSISVALLPGESYEAFVKRAGQTAQVQVQRYFETSSADSVLVTLNGSNAGLIAPVLDLNVTREQWTAVPQTEQWATYFPDSEVLLGLAEPAPQPDPAVARDGSDSDTAEADQNRQPSSTSVTITAPTGSDGAIDSVGREVAGDRVDGATEDGAIQPQTSGTTPDSNVAPLEVAPNAGTTSSGGVVDAEDSNDFEFVPDNNPDSLTDENGAIQPETSITRPDSEVAPLEVTPNAGTTSSDGTTLSDDAEVIIESD